MVSSGMGGAVSVVSVGWKKEGCRDDGWHLSQAALLGGAHPQPAKGCKCPGLAGHLRLLGCSHLMARLSLCRTIITTYVDENQ